MYDSFRRQAFAELDQQQFDLLVIGGGITGAGIARDAALRGLKVALLEKSDFGSGTSSKSSKLIHGGLRYLQHAEFGLVFEAVSERTLLLKLAPHLVKPLPFLFPLTQRWWERPYVAAGIFLYDQLGGAKSVPAQKHLFRAGALRPVIDATFPLARVAEAHARVDSGHKRGSVVLALG